MKLNKAQTELRAYAAALDKLTPAHVVCLTFALAVVPKSGTADEKKKAIHASAAVALDGMPNAAETLRNYIAAAAAIACVPSVKASVAVPKAEAVGDKATREVTAQTVKTAADMRALSKAANAKLGAKVRGTKGAPAGKAEPATTGTPFDGETWLRAQLSLAAGRAAVQRICEQCGYMLTPRMVAQGAPVVAPTVAPTVAAKGAKGAKGKGKGARA